MGINVDVKMDKDFLDHPLLRTLNTDAHVEKAIMDIAKIVITCGKERDVISFAGEMVFIATSCDQDSLNYMQANDYNSDFNVVHGVFNKNRHGVLFRYKYKHRDLPIMIMKVIRIFRDSIYSSVKFEVTIVDEFHDLVNVEFGVSIAGEVFE